VIAKTGRLLAALGVYVAAITVLGRDILTRLNTAIIGPGDFDNFYYAWSLWEFRSALLAGRLPGYTQDVYGQAASMTIFVEGFADHLVALPLQWFLTPVGAYNVTVLLGFVLGALAMHLLASEFTTSWTACVVAGLVFSFSTYHFARALGHLGLATLEVLPFCAWGLVVLWRRPSPGTAILAGAGAGLVAWAAVNYIAYFLLPFGLLLGTALLLTDWRWITARRNLALGGLAIGVALIVAAPSLIEYPWLQPDVLAAIHDQASSWELRLYSVNLVALFVPDPADPVLGRLFAGAYPAIPGVPERSAFLGVPALVFAALAVALRWRERATLAWLAVAVAGIALALGSGLRVGDRLLTPLPFYDLLYRWPLVNDFSAPNRLSVLALMGVAVLAARGVAAVISRLPQGRPWRLGASLGALAVTGLGIAPSLLFGYGLTALPIRVPDLYRALAAAPDDGLVLELPPATAGSSQYFQTISHKRLAAGVVPRLPDSAALQLENVPYYSLLAEGWPLPASDTSPSATTADIFPLQRFAAGLRAAGIAYVVLHRMSCIDPAALWPCYEPPNYWDSVRFLTNTLGEPYYADQGDGLTAWHLDAAPPTGREAATYRLGLGWVPYLGRLSDGEPRRMMGSQARVTVATAGGQAHLLIRASSYVRPMSLEVRFDGRQVAVAAIPVGAPLDLDVGPVQVRPGLNDLDLRSRQGCVVPDDLDPRYYGPNLDGIGYRCISFAVERVALAY
jgi:hypothetical protein